MYRIIFHLVLLTCQDEVWTILLRQILKNFKFRVVIFILPLFNWVVGPVWCFIGSLDVLSCKQGQRFGYSLLHRLVRKQLEVIADVQEMTVTVGVGGEECLDSFP